MTQRLPMVLVQWSDAAYPAGTATYEYEDAQRLEPITVYDVGFLVRKSAGVVVLSGNVSSGALHRRVAIIPRSLVRRIVYLSPRKRQRQVSQQKN